MGLKWIDSQELAIELAEQFPDIDPVTVRFTDLREWILALEDFDDDPEHCNERILEAVQMCWIEEAN
ncbi:Fe-S cluster assembly protein IscX [Photobacterium alginatilyticum]|uniref:Fe-S assembly protein IscX n=1 Tax=Photobacterium alginatilyticum TaxID=1775171 RepID=A0ABW9YKU9_9GAMM|nr:Fe-S cluster assembly protein IscX [Photobacterium alginatilyticum]NBI54464.1 Fe-S assembly protein IscX [Photobacterium alginatilyticum]